MPERSILFIVEGEQDEPAFIRRLFKICYPKQQYTTYSYQTNLHDLAGRLERDYPDFDGENTDIKLILRSYEPDSGKRDVLDGVYTDIFLIFDFEPQQDFPHFQTIRRMLEVFQDSTLQGKLFLNYPMMQSYKHFSCLPDPDFRTRKATEREWKSYKQIVGDMSNYTDVNQYTYQTIIGLIVHHLRKANYILTGRYEIPEKDAYLAWPYTDIFDKQLQSKDEEGWVYVLNTCIFVLSDYHPTSFFRQLRDRKRQFPI